MICKEREWKEVFFNFFIDLTQKEMGTCTWQGDRRVSQSWRY